MLCRCQDEVMQISRRGIAITGGEDVTGRKSQRLVALHLTWDVEPHTGKLVKSTIPSAVAARGNPPFTLVVAPSLEVVE